MKRTNKIVVIGFVWRSKQNGMILNVLGLSSCITIGQHNGCEPKIAVVYETS